LGWDGQALETEGKAMEVADAMRCVANKGGESPHLDALADWLRGVLLAIPDGETWPSRALYEHMESLGLGAPHKLINQSMWRLRASGKVDDLWQYDYTRRFMGHPLIMWRRPAVDPGVF
jgi:hypothetical protein